MVKKMKKLFFVLTTLMSFVTAAYAATPALEMKSTNGPGMVIQDITVYSDGTVTSASFSQPNPVVINNLNPSEMEQVENAISEIQAGPLMRTNPNQAYNPSGFVTAYILTKSSGQTFAFAENDSGIDLALNNSSVPALVQLLQGLARLHQ
jgi:hypothetical protein